MFLASLSRLQRQVDDRADDVRPIVKLNGVEPDLRGKRAPASTDRRQMPACAHPTRARISVKGDPVPLMLDVIVGRDERFDGLADQEVA